MQDNPSSSDNQPFKRRRLVFYVVIGAFLLALVVATILSRLNTYTVRIQADGAATVFVAINQEGKLEELGRGTVSFSTKQTEPVHFVVSNGTEESMVSVSPQNYDGQTIVVDLAPLSPAEKILEGPLVDPLIEKDTLYGISATTHSLISVGLTSFKPIEQSLVGLPYMNEVLWRNSDNFLYEKYAGGAGAFIDNQDQGASYFGSKTGNAPSILALSSFGDGPLVLLGDDGVYTSSDFGASLEKVFDTILEDLWHLDSDEENIYFSTYPGPGHYVTEGEGVEASELESPRPPDITLTVLDLNGQKTGEYKLPNSSALYSTGRLSDGRLAVLSNNSVQIFSIQSDSPSVYPLYTASSVDMVVSNEAIFIFNQKGIWKFNDESGVMQLVYRLDSNQDFVPESTEVTSGEASKFIQFTTVGTTSGSGGGVYKISP